MVWRKDFVSKNCNIAMTDQHIIKIPRTIPITPIAEVNRVDRISSIQL